MDTIAAVATPPGRSAVAVVRVSGPATRDVVGRIAGEAELEPRRATLRTIRDPATGRPVDRALVTFFPGPHSFTGEDVVELSGHGGSIVPQLLLDAVLAAGARHALPGEFTRRAYLAGKLDLIQAEATLDLIDATSSRMRDAALYALERGLSKRIETLRAGCLELQALLAYDIDFPEEDDGPLDRSTVASRAHDVAARIDRMVATADSGMLIREGALAVIAGRPNVGKSTLFNALLGVERAIVTGDPGTTRDAIEALWTADGYPFRLVDTAGVRTGAGLAETKGIEFARAFVDRADIVLLCAEAGRPLDEDELDLLAAIESGEARRTLIVRTKADVSDHPSVQEKGRRQYPVSAATGEGLDDLIKAITTTVYGNRDDETVVLRHRQSRALSAAASAMADFIAAWKDGAPAEIAATHLQDAVVALEDVLGIVTTEDVLDRLFAEFCVGK